MDVAATYYEEQRTLGKPITEAIAKGNSAIQKFYEGTSIFVTGGTGFIGKQLIEKLLRSCNINRIYVLIRPKKGIPTKERLLDYLKEPVYDELKKCKPEFAEKIVPIEGDVAEMQLGIGEKDWVTLTQEVNIIFHAAATINFDEHLSISTLINVRGTRELLTLAKSCKNLKAFVHVSTAYSHTTENRIGKEVSEKFYPCPMPPETIIELAENVDMKRLSAITSDLIHDWPNTYTFTKAIAEEAVRIMGKNLPICIVRPPIVTPSYYEPVPGWFDARTMYNVNGVMLGITIGAIHVTLNDDIGLEFVPVDFVTNTLIASAWDTAQIGHEDMTIYNIHNETGVTWGQVSTFFRSSEVRRFASPKAIWYGNSTHVTNKLLFWVLTWLFHYIPAYIVDIFCAALSIKMPKGIPSLVKIYEKIYKLSLRYSYFQLNEWDFKNGNTNNMHNRLSDTDKVIFNFDTKTIDWTRLFLIWFLGVRVFVIKDGLKGSAYGYKKQKVLKIITYLYISIYIIATWYILSVVVSFVRNIF